VSFKMLGFIVAVTFFFQGVVSKSAAPCTWDSKSGATFDLRALTLSSGTNAYEIFDGDIPCTPETEPSFNYVWNFCALIPPTAVPSICSDMGKTAVVLQWVSWGGYGDYCFILARDDNSLINYSLLDPSDPSKGISIAYPKGEKCGDTATSKDLRSATIDVKCANTEKQVQYAQEPSLCNYHMEIDSYYGCPKECAVTSKGLCDSHGHCAFDYVSKKAYCYCNEGYSGSDCSSQSSSTSTTYDGFSVQLGLLITLLLIAAGLTAGIAYMAFQISEYRKHQISNNYKSLSGGEAEMTETVNFRN